MNGLSSKEVLKSRELHGSNKLPEPKLDKWYDFAKEALSEKITMILIAIAVLQLFLGVMGVMDLSDPIMILVVLAIVTCIAVKTGLGVQKSAAELRAKTSVRYCNVIRDGKVQTINKDELVVGDLVCVGMGQEIFADGYLIEGKISVNNAAINGETKECKKTPIEGYVHKKTTSTDAYTNQNCLFAGTTVMSGEGKMIVTDVGVNTVNGDTLVKMQTLEAPKTALDIALDNLSDFISKWGTIAAVITFAVLTISGIVQVGFGEYFSGGVLNIIQKIAQNFSVALTIIVAAVPEGLPLIVKLVTKQNVKTMEKFNILAKNPGKIPELAYVDIICTDKTGTLTTGIMTPKKIIDGFGNDVNKDSVLWNNIKANISLNNSATFDSENNITGGNSIDRAVLSLVNPETYADIQKTYPVKLKQVFNSSNKYSAFTTKDGITYYKGAPEKLIEHCTKVMDSSGEIVDNNDNDKLSNAIKAMTSNAMRCIAVTMADCDLVENEIPNDMTFLGIIGVVDPVRDEVPSAVKTAHKAGIQVIEITGDCIETAVAVATECGIYKNGDLALTNDEFEAMSDDEVKSIIPRLRVISRCSPNTKLRLVTLAQEIGKSVAMTGDGVNDSPALNCCGGGGLEPKIVQLGNVNPSGKGMNGNVFDENGLAPTLTTNKGEGNKIAIRQVHKIEPPIRIRKLTPKECFRLMGFSDENFEAAEKMVSNSQLYKQAGNSIVVDVLYYILVELYKAMPYLFDDLRLSSFFSGIGAFEIALNRLYEGINSGNFTSPQAD